MTTEYDRRAEAWVRAKFPAASPDPGSVEFSTDCAAYHSGSWAEIDVSWLEKSCPVTKTLVEDAWNYDLTQIVREPVDIELPEASFTPSEDR